MMRCLKKENVSYRANSKVPTCRLYNNLIFLKEFFQGNSTDEKLLVSFNGTDENDIELPDSPHSGSSPTHNNESGSRKRSASSTAGDSTYMHVSKYARRDREKLDVIIANTLAKLTDQLRSDEENSDWLFCKSIVGLLGKLNPKRNRLARMEIQQVLMKYEFGDEILEEVPAEEAQT